MQHLLAPIGLPSPIHPIAQILLYNDLWHNRSLSVTLGDRLLPIGLCLLPRHLIAGQSADRSAPRTQQETEMGQVQIYDPTHPTTSENTTRALNQGRSGLSHYHSATQENDGCAHSTALCPPSEDMRAPVCLFVSLYNLMPKI